MNNIRTLVLAVGMCFTLSTAAHAQYFDWVRTYGGSNEDFGEALAVDTAGNVYVAVNFTGTMDVLPGPAQLNLTAWGIKDIALIKLDSVGNFIWVNHLSGYVEKHCYDLALDQNGNVCLTGVFGGTMDLDPGIGVFNAVSSNGSDGFVAKYDPDGNFLWGGVMGGTSANAGNDIEVDAQGNHYITGYFDSVADLDPGTDTLLFTTAGTSDAFIIKLDTVGNLEWVRTIQGNAGYDWGYHVMADNYDNIVVTGIITGNVDVDPGPGVWTLGNPGVHSTIVVKLDTDGNFIWGKAMGTTGDHFGWHAATDASDNIYICGYFDGTGDYNPGLGAYTLTTNGDNDGFLLKLDANGDFVWAHSIGSPLSDGFATMAVRPNGDVFVAGFFRDTLDADPSLGTAEFTSGGGSDPIVIHYNTNGQYQWAKALSGPDGGSFKEIIVDQTGDLFLAGYYQETMDFDPGPGEVQIATNGSDRYDGFVLKLDQCNAFAAISILNDGATCTGDTVLLAAETGATGYLWSTGDTTQTIAIVESGTYNVEVTNAVGCAITTASVDVELTDAAVSITELNGVLTATDAVYYQWYLNGEAIDGATYQSYTPLISGNYTVAAVNANGCLATSWAIEFTHTAIDEYAAPRFNVYPNNAMAGAAITVAASHTIGALHITDMAGRRVVAVAHVGSASYSFSTAALVPGCYIVQASFDQHVRTSKIILQ